MPPSSHFKWQIVGLSSIEKHIASPRPPLESTETRQAGAQGRHVTSESRSDTGPAAPSGVVTSFLPGPTTLQVPEQNNGFYATQAWNGGWVVTGPGQGRPGRPEVDRDKVQKSRGPRLQQCKAGGGEGSGAFRGAQRKTCPSQSSRLLLGLVTASSASPGTET